MIYVLFLLLIVSILQFSADVKAEPLDVIINEDYPDTVSTGSGGVDNPFIFTHDQSSSHVSMILRLSQSKKCWSKPIGLALTGSNTSQRTIK